MSAAATLAQALAYVDGCLSADQRREFERRLATDQGLAARVEQWRLQNEALRKTFGERAPGAIRGLLADEPSSPVINSPSPIRRNLSVRIGDAVRPALREPGVALFERPAAEPQRSAWRRVRRGSFALLAAAFFCALSASPAPVDSAPQLAFAAFSAYRTYAAVATHPEFATAETAALERWLRPQLGGWVVIPDLAAADFALIGARVVPGAQGPAAFALYRSSTGVAVGLLIESGEAALKSIARWSGALIAVPLAAPAPERAMLVGPSGAVDVDRLIRLARFSATASR
jgi:anti-sigma factor RsiW